MAVSDGPFAPPERDLVIDFWLIVAATLAAIAVAAVAWANVHHLSRWSTLFVDRESAATACLEAGTISVGLPAVPSFPILGGPGPGDLQWYLEQNARDAARSARSGELRAREIRMVAAAEGSRDLALAEAAAQGPEQLVSACRARGYPTE